MLQGLAAKLSSSKRKLGEIMCEHCHEDFVQPLVNQDIVLQWSSHTIGNGMDMNLKMKKKVNVLIYIEQEGGKCMINEEDENRISTSLKFKFCPMCGRQLTPKEGDADD